jgi:hypothetical protein
LLTCDPPISYEFIGEQLIRNQQVVSSNLILGSLLSRNYLRQDPNASLLNLASFKVMPLLIGAGSIQAHRMNKKLTLVNINLTVLKGIFILLFTTDGRYSPVKTEYFICSFFNLFTHKKAEGCYESSMAID